MKKLSELSAILRKSFGWHKSRMDCFVGMLFALFKVRTVNLREMAVSFVSDAQVDSRYKRLKRFFSHIEIDLGVVAKWAYQLFFTKTQGIYLTIDRTNWYIGKKKINILTLAIAHEGIAIPILWTLLDTAGNASAQAHIDVIARFVSIFGKENILGVLGDREFASKALFSWCNEAGIGFYIRIKEGSGVLIRKKKVATAKCLFKHLNLKEQGIFHMTVWLYGEKVYLAGSRSQRGELMIVAINQSPKNAIAIYLRRWEIECLFHALKSRGFHFEDTHITKLERINRLLVLLSIGFCWAHKIGEWHAMRKPILLNKHRESRRPQYSFFRYGFDYIRDILSQPKRQLRRLRQCMKLLDMPDFLTESGEKI